MTTVVLLTETALMPCSQGGDSSTKSNLTETSD